MCHKSCVVNKFYFQNIVFDLIYLPILQTFLLSFLIELEGVMYFSIIYPIQSAFLSNSFASALIERS